MKRFQKFAAILLMAVLALTMLTACGSSGGNTTPTPGSVEEAQKAKVIAAVNRARAKKGLEPLEENEDATAIAEKCNELNASYYYVDDPISEEEYNARWEELRVTMVDGRGQKGYRAAFATTALPADVWNDDLWEQNQRDTVITNSSAKWIGFAFVQRTSGMYKGRYVSTIVTY